MPINKYIIIACILFLLGGAGLQILSGNKVINDFLELKLLYNKKAEYNNMIRVKISGCVSRPGCYQLKYGNRFKDLIRNAGGLLAYADESKLSFFSLLKDGEEYFISARKLRIGEKIDINRVSMEILCMLPKVNTVLARNILYYREKYNGFKNIEELQNVSGIGNKKFELLKNFVIIGE